MSLVVNDNMEIVYRKPDTLTETPMHYCPGCGHGVVSAVSSIPVSACPDL